MSAGLILLVGGLLLAPAAAAAQSQPFGRIGDGQDMPAAAGAVLRALDTLNGSTRDLTLRAGETAGFGRLEIALDECRSARDDPEADARAFLRIRDVREAAPRFSGWMFASSPALSALDHPRYDVWVLSCSSR